MPASSRKKKKTAPLLSFSSLKTMKMKEPPDPEEDRSQSTRRSSGKCLEGKLEDSLVEIESKIISRDQGLLPVWEARK